MIYRHKFGHMTITLPYFESGIKENNKTCTNSLVSNENVPKLIPIDWSLKELSLDR